MRPPLLPWEQRPADYGNFFNPAFLAAVLASSCEGYETQKRDTHQALTAMPFALAFLAVPMAISGDFNAVRPKRRQSALPAWINKNPDLRASIANAAYWLVPAVREGLVFAFRSRQLQVDDAGNLTISA